MKNKLLEILVDPVNGRSLKLISENTDGDDISSGELISACGCRYRIRNGIPRLLQVDDENQNKTSTAFAFKWKKKRSYDNEGTRNFYADWLLKKYGFSSIHEWTEYFKGKERIMDLGCGSGFASSSWIESDYWSGDVEWVGVDISEAIDVARERLGHINNTHFIQADALDLPFAEGSFDCIYSEGVLHHTPSTKRALLSSAQKLSDGGEYMFYVYKKKAPIREYTDDYVRQAISGMTEDEAWEEMIKLTKLAKALAQVDISIHLDEDVPVLGIAAGTHDVQRLIYWNMAKLFWNDSLSFDGNVSCNYDWYKPMYAWRHTEEELRSWCREANLIIRRFHQESSGFAVIADKQVVPK